MQPQLIQILTNLGLTEKESKVFLACAEIGTSVVSEIAKKAELNRVTTYDILDKLKKKGLVSHFTKKKTKYFTSTDPETVLEEFEKRTNEFRSSLPQFKRIQGETAHPRIRYFEGIEGIKAIYTDTLSAKTEILNYSNSNEIRKIWPTYDKDYVEKRANKGIHLRGICPKDKQGIKVQSEDKKYMREMRLMPEKKFDFTNEINIYDDKVAIISFKDELIGMIIESREIANSQRAIFNMSWQFSSLMQNENNISKNIKNKMMEPIKNNSVPQQKEEEKKKDNLSLF